MLTHAKFYVSKHFEALAAKARIKALTLCGLPVARFSVFEQDTEEDDLCRAVVSNYTTNKQNWIVGYDMARFVPEIIQLASHQDLIDVVKAHTSIKDSVMSASKIVLRMDMPNDQNYDFPCHQDYSYNFGSLNSVTAWIPLQDTFEINGAVEILESQYLDSPLEHKLIRHKEGLADPVLMEKIINSPSSKLQKCEVKRG